MRLLKYVSGTGGLEVDLDAPESSLGTAAALRGREWSYTLGYRGITGATRDAREVELHAAFVGMGGYDRARRVFDRDVAMGTPGTLVWRGEWETEAYVVKSEPDAIFRQTATADPTMVLVDGVWRKPVTVQFNPSEDPESDFLDLPYDLPYDLAPVGAVTEVDGPEWMPSPVKIVVYGQANSPQIEIGGNLYAVDCAVQAGGYLVIDGLKHEVYEVSADGAVTNRISSARRGSGEGSGEYCFEKVGVGLQQVTWPHSFGFDLTYYIEEGEPPCS